jgi:hypothetical protein
MYDLTTTERRKIHRDMLPKTKSNGSNGVGKLLQRGREWAEGRGAAYLDNVLEPRTIDSVQGDEKGVVILSMVQDGPVTSFFTLNRINVASSRAQNKLVFIVSRGIKSTILDSIETRLKRTIRGFGRVRELPRGDKNKPIMPASLRAAWNLSTGDPALDQKIDVVAMPPLETVFFLSVLALGLSNGNATLIAMGMVMKLIVFPLLHVWGNPRKYNFKEEAIFAGALTSIYLLAWLLQVIFIPGAGWHPEWVAMLPVALAHRARNENAASWNQLKRDLAIQKVGVDEIDGANSLIASQVPPAGAAVSLRSWRLSHQRAALSGA